MKDAGTNRRIDSPRALRAERGAAAVVAQYIHELSDRHAASRGAGPALAGRPGNGCGADHQPLGAPTR
jgi:hypothetical protein